MMFTLEKERVHSSLVPLDAYELRMQNKKRYQRGLQLGLPPKFIQPPKSEVMDAQPYDMLALDGIEALHNISYNQEQLDFINYHAIAIRQALAPVISAFAPTPQDMGIVMNFCT